VLVTGATGLFGLPVALALAADNDVVAAARFTDTDARRTLEVAGIATVRWDLLDRDLSVLPASADYVVHAAAILPARELGMQNQQTAFEANAQAVGRLMWRYQDCRGFLHSSSSAVYSDYCGEPVKEEHPLGLAQHSRVTDYILSKIAAEQLVEFLSRQLEIPSVILRIFALYGPRGGSPVRTAERIRQGQPVPIHPGGPIYQTVMFETDYVDKAIRLLDLATVPPLTVNFAGTEDTTVEGYCQIVADLIGTTVEFEVTDRAWAPLRADVTKLRALVGSTAVTAADGFERMLKARHGEPDG
jgi:nucleoside-diphosphate-sugar epimerase